jgi:hypothetical protein
MPIGLTVCSAEKLQIPLLGINRNPGSTSSRQLLVLELDTLSCGNLASEVPDMVESTLQHEELIT